jgi:hypothetical protein
VPLAENSIEREDEVSLVISKKKLFKKKESDMDGIEG